MTFSTLFIQDSIGITVDRETAYVPNVLTALGFDVQVSGQFDVFLPTLLRLTLARLPHINLLTPQY